MKQATPTDNATWLTPAQVAERFHVSPITVRNWSNQGKLPSRTTPGGHRRYLLEDVEVFAQQQNSSITPAPIIMIVDDDPAVLALLCDLLAAHLPQASFITAEEGFEAGFLIREQLPDLIFLDILMPGLTGDKVCQQIKGHDRTRAIPIIGISGNPCPETVANMIESGAECVIEKPFDTAALYALTDSLLPHKTILRE